MIEMAQRAGQNEFLCAGLIRKYGERRNLQWDQIAGQLNMDNDRLATLALCRAPRPKHLSEEVEQIAGIWNRRTTNHHADRRPPARPARGTKGPGRAAESPPGAEDGVAAGAGARARAAAG